MRVLLFFAALGFLLIVLICYVIDLNPLTDAASIFATHRKDFPLCIVPTTEPLEHPVVSAAVTYDERHPAACTVTVSVPKGWRCWQDEKYKFQVRDAAGSPMGFAPQPVCHKDAQ